MSNELLKPRTIVRTVRFRVYEGRLLALDPVELVEGTEVEVCIATAPPAVTDPRPKVVLDTWDLGPMRALTREEIYEGTV